MMCPINGEKYCWESKCGFWNDEGKKCSIVVFSDNVSQIANIANEVTTSNTMERKSINIRA